MPKKVAQTEILAAAQTYQPRAVEFLHDLVRIRSVNGRDAESPLAERVLYEARALDLPARLIAKDPSRPNVLVEIGEGDSGFLLVAHMDTVPEGDAAAWQHPPFEAVVENGILFGRGAADNKAGIACSLYTFAMLRDQNLIDLSRIRLQFAGVVDEENGASSKLGVRYLLDQGLIRARGAIYTYTSDIVCVGHRGLLRFALSAHGQTVHSGSPEWAQGKAGINAVTSLASILIKLEALRMPYPQHPAFSHLKCTITPGTTFSGGEWTGMVPALAKATVDVRLMPGQDAQKVIDELDEIISQEEKARPGLRVDREIPINLPGAAIPLDHPLVLSAQKHAQAFTGHEWRAEGAGPANEGYMLIGAGIPTLCGFGANGGNPHAPDEWVELESIPTTTAVYASIIKDYCA